MATKSKQMAVRLDQPMADDLEHIAEQYQHTPAGLLRLGADLLIKAYKAEGQLPVPRTHTDKPEATAAAVGGAAGE